MGGGAAEQEVARLEPVAERAAEAHRDQRVGLEGVGDEQGGGGRVPRSDAAGGEEESGRFVAAEVFESAGRGAQSAEGRVELGLKRRNDS